MGGWLKVFERGAVAEFNKFCDSAIAAGADFDDLKAQPPEYASLFKRLPLEAIKPKVQEAMDKCSPHIKAAFIEFIKNSCSNWTQDAHNEAMLKMVLAAQPMDVDDALALGSDGGGAGGEPEAKRPAMGEGPDHMDDDVG